MQILDQNHYLTNQWAGGQTTQLWIYPEQASLQNRDFQIRISSALVQQEGAFSDFTGFNRALLILEGEGLEVSQHNEAETKAFNLTKASDTWYFSGSDTVSAKLISGDVVDFNLITAPEIKSEMSFKPLAANETLEISASKTLLSGVYLIAGEATLSTGERLNAGQLLLCDQEISLCADQLAAKLILFRLETTRAIL